MILNHCVAVDWNDAVFSYLRRHEISNVIIVSRWCWYVQAETGPDSASLGLALNHTVQSLSENGIRVWIIQQVPEQQENPQRGLALAVWSGRELPLGVSLEQHVETQQHVLQGFSEAALNGAVLLDPESFCFDGQERSRLGSEIHSFYRDENHLSDTGAVEFVQPLLRPIFAELAANANRSSIQIRK